MWHHIYHYWQVHYQDNFWAGVIQTVFIGFVAYVATFVCHERLCFRPGWHRVKGTHHRTCNKHATKDIHQKWQRKHFAKHPEQHKFLKGQA